MAKILVVEEDEHTRLQLSEELKEAGYEVVTAERGYKLLEKIGAEKPDVVILDMKKVDYKGLDLLQDIRNYFCDLPVILATELVATIVSEGEITKSQAEKTLDEFISAVSGSLPSGDKITLLGFRTFNSWTRSGKYGLSKSVKSPIL